MNYRKLRLFFVIFTAAALTSIAAKNPEHVILMLECVGAGLGLGSMLIGHLADKSDDLSREIIEMYKRNAADREKIIEHLSRKEWKGDDN